MKKILFLSLAAFTYNYSITRLNTALVHHNENRYQKVELIITQYKRTLHEALTRCSDKGLSKLAKLSIQAENTLPVNIHTLTIHPLYTYSKTDIDKTYRVLKKVTTKLCKALNYYNTQQTIQ